MPVHYDLPKAIMIVAASFPLRTAHDVINPLPPPLFKFETGRSFVRADLRPLIQGQGVQPINVFWWETQGDFMVESEGWWLTETSFAVVTHWASMNDARGTDSRCGRQAYIYSRSRLPDGSFYCIEMAPSCDDLRATWNTLRGAWALAVDWVPGAQPFPDYHL